jgi:hypothetical protein
VLEYQAGVTPDDIAIVAVQALPDLLVLAEGSGDDGAAAIVSELLR